MLSRTLAIVALTGIPMFAAVSTAQADRPGHNARQHQNSHRNHNDRNDHRDHQDRRGIGNSRHVVVQPQTYEMQRVLVAEGHYRTEYTPAVYSTRRGPRGTLIQVLVTPACTRRVWIPAQYEWRRVAVCAPTPAVCPTTRPTQHVIHNPTIKTGSGIQIVFSTRW